MKKCKPVFENYIVRGYSKILFYSGLGIEDDKGKGTGVIQ